MRAFLNFYRNIQYFIFGRDKLGAMSGGENVKVEHFRYEVNHGDIVHPCVRYISDGYLGHYWWMAYTPYYKNDSSLENPVLCYAEGNDPNTPPAEWKYFCLVNEKPLNGYNSDPTLLFYKGTLYVFWRENYDANCEGYNRATYAAKVAVNGIERIADPLLVTEDSEMDPETCPCFMPSKEDYVMAYGMHLRFHSPFIKKMKPVFRRWAEKITLITDLLGGYSQQKHYGLAIWRQGDSNWLKPYKLVKTIEFKNCNKLYRPWHMDFFDYNGKRYAIVQTNQSNADLSLAVSEDYENFSFFKHPVLTNLNINKLGIYKPCAGVTPDGRFYLYYTAQDKDNRSLNKLYLTTIGFDELLKRIK